MAIEKITGSWDAVNLERINQNFELLNSRELEFMKDFLSTDPSTLTPLLNGKEKLDNLDMHSLNNFGINFRAEVNGIIYKASVYANRSGKLGVGLAKQLSSDVMSEELYYKTVNLKRGWNEIVLNFPVEQNVNYTLFRRSEGDVIQTANLNAAPWGSHPFIENGIKFIVGKFLDETTTYGRYSTFFEIQLITSLAQIYKIANDSVKPAQQFYVGDNPPQDAQFWFKPVSGGGN